MTDKTEVDIASTKVKDVVWLLGINLPYCPGVTINIPDMYWNSVFEIGEFIQFLEQQITEPKSAEEAAAAIYHEGFRYLDNFKTMSGERERAIDFLFENINTILFAEYVATSVNRSELQ